MNPIIKTVYAPDPSAHVWDDKGTLWIYASNDMPYSNNFDTMYSYHVFSTTDMVNFTDYGCVFNIDSCPWAAMQMFAIDAAYRHGKYYLIYCATDLESGIMRTGVAVSKNPQGPFVDQGKIENTGLAMDPALFTDDDGTPYLYYAGKNGPCVAQLYDDLMSVKTETVTELGEQLPYFFEGPFLHKYKGRYYLTYPGLKDGKWPQFMNYAVSDHPLGPFEYRGQYIPVFEGQTGNNHGSVVEFKGKWYAFHHSMWISGKNCVRSMMCDYLEYDEKGDIKPIKPTKEGVCSTEENGVYESKTTVLLDAAGAPLMKGKHVGIRCKTDIEGYTGDGYVEGFDKPQYSLTVMAQAGIEYEARLKVRYMAPSGDVKMQMLVNGEFFSKPDMTPGCRIDKYSFKGCDSWQVADICDVTLKPGENYISIYSASGDIKIDSVLLEEK
ncbi:MAG: family 43 glycosylhydrolase [Clostridia bacterium]|nr:family 43 glycosylhydrolase [Clostridia bacterium]